jgi:hypothetical protein
MFCWTIVSQQLPKHSVLKTTTEGDVHRAPRVLEVVLLPVLNLVIILAHSI